MESIVINNKMNNYAKFDVGNQPKIQVEKHTFAITYRLNGSLPVAFILDKKAEYDAKEDEAREKYGDSLELEQRLLRLQQENFIEFDAFLDKNPNEPHYLQLPEVAEIVGDSLHHLAKSYYELHAFCIMPNHVHVLLTLIADAPNLAFILERHKRYTGLQCNKIIGKIDNFWTAGCYEHAVRTEVSFLRYCLYTLNNPVKAGLVEDWRDWEHYYCNPDLLKHLVIGA